MTALAHWRLVRQMSLDLVVGPMWAGKSSHILGKIRRYRAIGWDVLVVVHPLDTRYGTQVVSTHDKEQLHALAVEDIASLQANPAYQSAQLVVIEEAQFFKGLYEFVKTAVETDNKHVLCVGLDGDANRKPFGDVLALVPLCDSITKIQSLCVECKDGTAALFTHRMLPSEAQIQVGAEESYVPLCRKHYLAKNSGSH